jgi:hypothetical protein
MSQMTSYSGQILLLINLLFIVLSGDVNMAHALPTIPLAALAAYQLYLKQVGQPDYRKEYEEKVIAIQNQFVKQIAERDEFYISEIKRISEEQSRLNISTIKPQAQAKQSFRF